MNPTWVAAHGMPDGEYGGVLEVRFITDAPPCHNSMAANAPCACTASVIIACERISLSSHSLPNGSGLSSEEGWVETAPVVTTPQPPSAFMPRNAALTLGFASVMPLAWGTW